MNALPSAVCQVFEGERCRKGNVFLPHDAGQSSWEGDQGSIKPMGLRRRTQHGTRAVLGLPMHAFRWERAITQTYERIAILADRMERAGLL